MIVLGASAALAALLDAGPAKRRCATSRSTFLTRSTRRSRTASVARDNLSAYDAWYVALAEALGCALVTGNARLARALGVRCPVTVVRG